MSPPAATPVGRKRKRKGEKKERLQQYGIDLPDIPGLPIQVIPLHVFALRKTGVFFRKNAVESLVKPFRVEGGEGGDSRDRIAMAETRQAAVGGVMASIMHRVDEAAAAVSQDREDLRQKKQRLQECRDAVQSWLQALRREMKDSKGSAGLFGAVEHLWGFLVDSDERIAVRRTCLHLLGHLMAKSAESRRWFLEESNHLGRWTEALVHPSQTDTPARLFQREGFLLLRHLDTMGYSDLYPRLRVAIQRFQQQFPWIEESNLTTGTLSATSLPLLRQRRDLAMDKFQTEEAIVRRLLVRCDKFMRIIVPRFGDESVADEGRHTESHEEAQTRIMDDANGEEDDEDIDWEDGITDHASTQQTFDIESSVPEESHAEAVERTLAVMQSTARMQTGQLEISFDTARDATIQETLTQSMIEARAELSKCANILKTKHVERLNTWVDALTRADTLIESEGRSLVQMASDLQHRRRVVLQKTLELKAEVMTSLSSAMCLVTLSVSDVQPTQSAGTLRQAGMLRSHTRTRATQPATNERLATALNRRRAQTGDHSKKRSARVRIKYR
jgi:hypothetical protein